MILNGRSSSSLPTLPSVKVSKVAKTKVESTKQQKFQEVAMALAHLLNSVGPLKITHSQVAKRSNVSRAWIYKYIGADREDLIRFAIEHLGKEVTERDREEKINSKEDLVIHVTKGIERMLSDTEKYPWLLPVYFRYRGTETEPGKVIDLIERAYVKRQAEHLAKNFESYSEAQATLAAEVLTSFRMGLAFSWQRGDIRRKTGKEELLASVQNWIHELFHA